MKRLKNFINQSKLYPIGTIPNVMVENSQYDLLGQVAYFIKNTYGEKEYKILQDAGVISLQDGDTTINITTIEKPEGTHADSITKVLRGWLLSYKKYDGLKEDVRTKTKMVKEFADSILKKFPVKDIKLFYYPITANEDVIMLNYLEVNKTHKNSGIGSRIMEDLIKFADNQSFILTLDTTDKFGSSTSRLKEFYKRFGFKENKEKRFNKEMVRMPVNGIK